MAEIKSLVDDFDNSILDGVETVQFGYKGKDYEIDLGVDNQKILEENLVDFIKNARPLSSRVAGGAKRTRSLTRSVNSDSAKVREWALANGYEVNKRGRISEEIQQAYSAANPA